MAIAQLKRICERSEYHHRTQCMPVNGMETIQSSALAVTSNTQRRQGHGKVVARSAPTASLTQANGQYSRCPIHRAPTIFFFSLSYLFINASLALCFTEILPTIVHHLCTVVFIYSFFFFLTFICGIFIVYHKTLLYYLKSLFHYLSRSSTPENVDFL